jgi:hypothetical protein
MRSNQSDDAASIEREKLSREELLAELDRIRAMTPPRKPGVIYPTAEQLVREDRDAR